MNATETWETFYDWVGDYDTALQSALFNHFSGIEVTCRDMDIHILVTPQATLPDKYRVLSEHHIEALEKIVRGVFAKDSIVMVEIEDEEL